MSKLTDDYVDELPEQLELFEYPDSYERANEKTQEKKWDKLKGRI